MGLARGEEAERQHHCQRPRRVPHHHGFIGVAAGSLLKRQKLGGIVRVLTVEGEPCRRPVLDEIVRRPDARIVEKLSDLTGQKQRGEGEAGEGPETAEVHAGV